MLTIHYRDEQLLRTAGRSLTTTEIVLQPTAVVEINDRDNVYSIRALLNLCSNSWIHVSVVRKYRLPTLRLLSDYAWAFTVLSRTDALMRIRVTARIHEDKHPNIPTMSADSNVADSLKNMVLADPRFNQSASISLVLGSELNPWLMHQGIIQQPGHPKLGVWLDVIWPLSLTLTHII